MKEFQTRLAVAAALLLTLPPGLAASEVQGSDTPEEQESLQPESLYIIDYFSYEEDNDFAGIPFTTSGSEMFCHSVELRPYTPYIENARFSIYVPSDEASWFTAPKFYWKSYITMYEKTSESSLMNYSDDGDFYPMEIPPGTYDIHIDFSDNDNILMTVSIPTLTGVSSPEAEAETVRHYRLSGMKTDASAQGFIIRETNGEKKVVYKRR